MRGATAADRPQGKEGVIDALVHHIQFGLKGVEKLAQPARDYFLISV
jgi:hypothetical protein